MMKSICIGLFAGAVGCAFALLNPAAEAATETVVYSFCSQPNCADGASPRASLIDVNGTLYGTTVVGGTGAGAVCSTLGSPGCGTVFSLDPKTGTETVLYSFFGQQNCTDGANPLAGLTDVNGTLYGTTYYGGAHGGGAVFAVNPTTRAETVLYSFCGQQNCADGEYPQAGLIDVNGTLYGVAQAGGTNTCGTVFALNPSTGREKTLHSFDCADGEAPSSSLINVKGTLYGTVQEGGKFGGGTAFAFDRENRCANSAL